MPNTAKSSQQAECLQLGELNIRIVRSRRKSISLQIKPDGIVLRAPLFSPQVILKAFALSKIDWLRKHQQRFAEKPPQIQRHYTDGETWRLFGEPIQLKVLSGKKSSVQYQAINQTLIVTVSHRVKQKQKFVRQKIIDWYKSLALEYLETQVPAFAHTMQLHYRSFSVREYKARWGSCSSQGDLSFNWRIFMAPPSVIDSVIVHELAHIKHFNHSSKFWQLVHSTYPDYKKQHHWLTEYQYELQA